ncbi:MAG: rod shape-determining protein MreD [Balneolaceae bacterium]
MNRYSHVQLILAGILILLVQLLLMRHLTIFGTEGDLLLVWLVWMASWKDRTQVLLYTAAFSFLLDLGTEMWGVHTFAKTLLIYLTHTYLNNVSANRLIFWQVFLILLAMAVVHQVLIVLLTELNGIPLGPWNRWTLVSVGSLYTAFIGSFLYLIRN